MAEDGAYPSVALEASAVLLGAFMLVALCSSEPLLCHSIDSMLSRVVRPGGTAAGDAKAEAKGIANQVSGPPRTFTGNRGRTL